jgi:tetrahydromethanopterin S-methyltransferase subunit G
MSGNRSVQAAQRRRAGNVVNDQPLRKPAPTPSINSAQMFARPATSAQNIPNGRIAGQQAAFAQKEMMKQQYMETQENANFVNVNKITIAKAITLLSLRVGKLESLSNHQTETLDKELIHTIMERLDALENKDNDSIVNEVKQSVEKSIVPQISQSKNTLSALVKDNNNLKTQINQLKNEINELKELIKNVAGEQQQEQQQEQHQE